jgi:membrane protease YdiL (CAAX protease family)
MLTSPSPRRYPWRLFFLLFLGAVVSVMAIVPYLSAMLGPVLVRHPLRLPLPALALIQGSVNFAIATGLGLLLARKIGLGAPILESWLYHEPPPPHRPILLPACLTGFILSVVVLALVATPAGAALRHLAPIPESSLALWKRLLACLYGGLGEEILMRLFLLSLLLWLLSKLFRVAPVNRALFWTVNLAVAIAFGAGHLPFAASLTTLTPGLIVAIIGFNAFFGLGFGYLYWSRGLEAAMLAHFVSDLMLHVIGPAFS